MRDTSSQWDELGQGAKVGANYPTLWQVMWEDQENHVLLSHGTKAHMPTLMHAGTNWRD